MLIQSIPAFDQIFSLHACTHNLNYVKVYVIEIVHSSCFFTVKNRLLLVFPQRKDELVIVSNLQFILGIRPIALFVHCYWLDYTANCSFITDNQDILMIDSLFFN